MKNIQAFIIGLLAISMFGTITANAAIWTVTKAANSNDNVCDADCSLREAVFKADSGDTVVFSSNLIGQTITLGGSDINITKRITIDGFLNDPNVAFISGSNTSRHFYVEDGAGLNLRNITLVQGNGKAVENQVGTTDGGAIYVRPTATLLLERVSIRGNSAYFGGAISLSSGTHHIINSSITSNSGSAASAIFNNGGTLYIANVTISGNLTPDLDNSGHAIWNQQNSGFTYIRNSTIVRNTATANGGEGGGIFNRLNGTLNIGNTIVAQNTDENGSDIKNEGATIVSVGGNLIGDLGNVPASAFNQPKDIFGVNPLLAPINANSDGFPVNVHPLQAGSPARNGGLNQNAVDPLTNQPLTTDARGAGFPRIADTTVDIGAFEDQSGNTSLIVSKKTNSNDLVCDVDCSLREAVYQAGLNFGTDTITFAPNVFGTLELGGTEILINNQNVNIVGYPTLSANTLVISGGDANRIFRLNNATANISGMTLANGDAGAGFGGAVLAENNSNLILDKVIVRNNFATAYGAIYLSGGTHRIINSTINTNSANTGLALGISGTLNMANATVSGNFDADGGAGIGAIYLTGTANIRNSTIVFNRTSGGTGGGIFSAGTLNIGNSIVAGNIAAVAPDIHLSSGTITSVGGNLVQNTSGFPAGTFNQTNDQTDVDALLAPLNDNGGNVPTLSLMANSPAINSGVNSVAVDPFNNSLLVNDARGAGFARINGTVDKGAFETLMATAASVSVLGRVTDGMRGLARAKVYLTAQNGETRTAMTNSFGYFTFTELQAGESYIVNVYAKRHTFLPQVISANGDLSDLNFSPQ
ncbi:MAG TPA: carboxypeptidase-like regulatory domain-containing protein [Pyrinomonadaceae bacterium]|nr:carboxypeptidase-like regulatory domain-containing protein [Pyrinomonadaceae bacterium]